MSRGPAAFTCVATSPHADPRPLCSTKQIGQISHNPVILNDSNTTVCKQTDSMPRHLLLNVSSEIDLSEVDDLSIGSSSSNGTTVYVSEKELYSQIMAA